MQEASGQENTDVSPLGVFLLLSSFACVFLSSFLFLLLLLSMFLVLCLMLFSSLFVVVLCIVLVVVGGGVVVVVVVVCAVLVLCVLYFFDMDSVVRVLSRTLACSMYWAWLKTLLNALPNALFSAPLNIVLHHRSCGYSWDTLLDALLMYSLTTLSPTLLIVLVHTLDYALLNALL